MTLPTQENLAAEKGPARRKGRERRQQILEAARKELLESGVDGLVLREIAQNLGITHGNLQYYFKTRADLLKAIFDEEVSKYTDTMQQSVEVASTRQGRISGLVDSSIELLKSEEIKLWHILFGVAHQSPELAQLLEAENGRYEEAFALQLKPIIPEATDARRMHIAKIVRVMIDGMGITVIYERPDSPSLRALTAEIKVLIGHLIEIE